jgi:uncharacterized membrane protein (UPF0182 family)
MKPDQILLLTHGIMYLLMFIGLPVFIKKWVIPSDQKEYGYWPGIVFQSYMALAGSFISLYIWQEVRDRLIISHVQNLQIPEDKAWFLALAAMHLLTLAAIFLLYLIGNWIGRLNLVKTSEEEEGLKKFTAISLYGISITTGLLILLSLGIGHFSHLVLPKIDQYLIN